MSAPGAFAAQIAMILRLCGENDAIKKGVLRGLGARVPSHKKTNYGPNVPKMCDDLLTMGGTVDEVFAALAEQCKVDRIEYSERVLRHYIHSHASKLKKNKPGVLFQPSLGLTNGRQ